MYLESNPINQWPYKVISCTCTNPTHTMWTIQQLYLPVAEEPLISCWVPFCWMKWFVNCSLRIDNESLATWNINLTCTYVTQQHEHTVNTHVHLHTHIHTYSHTHTQNLHTCTTKTYTHMHAHTHTHTHTHTRTHARTHAHTRLCIPVKRRSLLLMVHVHLSSWRLAITRTPHSSQKVKGPSSVICMNAMSMVTLGVCEHFISTRWKDRRVYVIFLRSATVQHMHQLLKHAVAEISVIICQWEVCKLPLPYVQKRLHVLVKLI